MQSIFRPAVRTTRDWRSWRIQSRAGGLKMLCIIAIYLGTWPWKRLIARSRMTSCWPVINRTGHQRCLHAGAGQAYPEPHPESIHSPWV